MRAGELLLTQPPERLRTGIRDMLAAIRPSGGTADWEREVKTGPGGIRDIEFLTQYLQIACGPETDSLRQRSTTDALVYLADTERILPGEYQHLTSAYVFQRSVEHALQLMHNRQRYTLPSDERELRYLAGRLDFDSTEQFLSHYREHRRYVNDIVRRRLADEVPLSDGTSDDAARHLGAAAGGLAEVLPQQQLAQHVALLDRLGADDVVRIQARQLPEEHWELTVVGFDQLGDLSLMCGLLYVSGLDVESGFVFTGTELAEQPAVPASRRKFVNVFQLRPRTPNLPPPDWRQYELDLERLLRLAAAGRLADAQGWLARQPLVAPPAADERPAHLSPIEIGVENDRDPAATVLHIRGEDTPGFLYELCNALATSDVSIQRMQIDSTGSQVTDTLWVTDPDGRKITDPQRVQELRAAIVLTRHFTRLLPASSSPGAALQHFRELLRDLFQQGQWLEQLASLQQPDVLAALARVFGESDFLWEDFLRLHYAELFPVLSNLEGLAEVRDRSALTARLDERTRSATTAEARRVALNAFKDQEMFRIDMRHILGLQGKFGVFSQELTGLAEAVVDGAIRLMEYELQGRFGRPRRDDGSESRLAVCALGKFGGQELGYASDIELLFVYESEGHTSGPEVIANADYFSRLVDGVARTIQARQQGIFEIDLRLRPYGNAGAPAVSREAFERYYDPDGPAWPYERQALVKLRPVVGDPEFGATVVTIRDHCVYSGRPFDLPAMRGLRERQVRELVQAGEFNAKLSPGGVVDVEYFVQALQITHGAHNPRLRSPNTRAALRSLEAASVLPDRRPLRDAYRFLRRLIDALRMVRGHAHDLAVPPAGTDQFEFLARRLGYGSDPAQLSLDLDGHTRIVREHMQRLETLLPGGSAQQPPERGE